MPLLEVDGITGGYGDTEILRKLSMKVDADEVVSIIGPNGAGKSTLMKTVFGLLHPREGSIHFDGHDISHMPPHQIVLLGMCYVPQVANVFTTLTVEENLEMGAYTQSGSDLDGSKQRVYEMFPKLFERRRQAAGKMSGGERQMVAMGSALMLNPKLLLLDEPTAALSPKLVDEIFDRVAHINKTGIAIMMVEQNARQSLAMAHRGYVLANGENRQDGTGQELLDDPNVGHLYLGG
ncbi:MAG: ABC transporter ATP-binding protein [Alcaligenaceae bacterium]|nr:ABC transporter ATP-binding protein [Alcaligenaceae bacterium]